MRILSRFSLPDWSGSRLHHLVIAWKLFVASPPTKASGSIVISATKSSPSRESRHHRTRWYWWIVGYHFYRDCDLNTITIYSANLKLFLYFHNNQHTSKNSNSCNTNTPQRALTTRFSRKNRPESQPLFFHHHVSNHSHRTIARTERGDRLRQFAQDSWHSGLSILWEREVWMNVESPLGRVKRIFWAEMKDTVL